MGPTDIEFNTGIFGLPEHRKSQLNSAFSVTDETQVQHFRVKVAFYISCEFMISGVIPLYAFPEQLKNHSPVDSVMYPSYSRPRMTIVQDNSVV